ncbi:hypothetical protein RND71_027383 [Anisodus tanguticus]|uniref:Uncharacterized protein n=1 Tax=Anisodus tanguticus TaxID=243964 RepID=A0AAE1V8Z5_9SOLA|nr:hypothetical protein RND71_027383 [Anisodus tanguticus]
MCQPDYSCEFLANISYTSFSNSIPPSFVDLETTSNNESPSPRKSVPKQPRRNGGVVIRDCSEEESHRTRVLISAEEEEEIEGPQLTRRRRPQKAFDNPFHIGGSSSSAHASTHPQDPLSVVLKAKISPVKATGDFYVDAAVEEMVGDNPSIETNLIDDSEATTEIIPEGVLLKYFG